MSINTCKVGIVQSQKAGQLEVEGEVGVSFQAKYFLIGNGLNI